MKKKYILLGFLLIASITLVMMLLSGCNLYEKESLQIIHPPEVADSIIAPPVWVTP